jgi:hypothetical protein
MYEISGGGVFSSQNIKQINSNFAELSQPDIWVRPQFGSNTSGDGSYAKPFASMSGTARVLKAGMVVGIEGVLREEYSGPIINDVTLVGMGNQPRQATTAGAPNGGGATWLSPSGGTGSLLTINGQSWKVQNIYFNNSATGATTGCIKLVGGGDPPLTPDAGGTQIFGCRFTGEANGIYIDGGPGFLDIAGNTFMFFDTSGDCAILAGGSGGTGFGTVVRDNQFEANLTHIKALSTAYGWNVHDNHFSYVKGGVTTVVFIDFTGGNQNSVYRNVFDVNSGNGGIASMFVLGTTDVWAFNTLGSAVSSTIFSFGDPA